MKTNVTLESKDRKLYDVVIRQDTKSGFLCVTDLNEVCKRQAVLSGWSSNRADNILSYNDAAERIYYILREQHYTINPCLKGFIEDVEKESLIKVIKKAGAYKTLGARENKRVMSDPYIWILLAMEMNPELYAKVVMWVGDKLILNRLEAGDNYNKLARAIGKFKDADYAQMAKGLNYIVFNIHESLLRNKATQEELKELNKLQESLVFAIDMGYINSFNELMSEMRKIYKMKYNN